MALLVAPGTARAAAGVLTTPDSTASGTVRVSWTHVTHAAQPQLIRREGAITFTIEDRMRSPGATEAWLPGELPDFALKNVRTYYGGYLRARVSVERYAVTADDTCQDGSDVRTTTVVTGVTQPHGLLWEDEPSLNLVRRTGTSRLAIASADLRDGPHLLRHEFFGLGAVATSTTGADCGGYDEQGRSSPRAVDRTDELPLGRLMGSPIVVAATVAGGELPMRVADGGATVIDRPHPLLYQGTHGESESIDGVLTPDLRFGGPPRAQRALCELPSLARMTRVRSRPVALALLRRYGIPSAAYGGRRYNAAPAGTFFTVSSSGEGYCGVRLGSRRYPGLYRSLGIRRG